MTMGRELLKNETVTSNAGVVVAMLVCLLALVIVYNSAIATVTNYQGELSFVFVALALLICGSLLWSAFVVWTEVSGLLADHAKKRAEERKAIVAGRAGVRQRLRLLLAEAEDDYGWIRYLPIREQRQRVLMDYQQFVAHAMEQNRRYQHLRSEEEYQRAVRDLGTPARQSIALLARRQQLLLWAVSRATKAQVAQMELRERRQERQLQVIELQEAEKFKERVTEEGG